MPALPALRNFIHVCSFACVLILGTIAVQLGCVSGEPVSEDDFPILSGPYLGQTLPAGEPQMFAPGIVNTGLYTRDVAMMPDGSEIYFGVNVGNYAFAAIMVTRELDGRWTKPEVASFSSDPRWSDIEPAISPDGRMMYFASDRPLEGGDEPEDHHSIWAMPRDGEAWGEPYPLPETINDGSSNFYPSVTRDGTLYFTRDLPDGRNVIFRSRLAEGLYEEPEVLPEQVNAGPNQFNAFIAPDETYLIVPMFGMPDTVGSTDYYIVFRNEDDSWSDPVNLGELINTEGGLEYAPYVSPDGKAFFFMSGRRDEALLDGLSLSADKLRELHNTPGTGLPGIWWVDASFLSRLRP